MKTRRIYTYLCAAVAVIFIILWLKTGNVNEPLKPSNDTSVQKIESIPVTDNLPKVKVSVFYETLCPDSIAFIVRQLWPAFQVIGSIMTIHLIPYGKASYIPSGGSWTFTCQHGKRECEGNMIHACVIDAYPNITQSLAFVQCSMSSHDPVTASETCAYKGNLDYLKISDCAKGDHGRQLLHSNGVATESLKPKLVYVPWILIDDTFTEAQLEAALENLLGVVCKAYKGPKPEGCPA